MPKRKIEFDLPFIRAQMGYKGLNNGQMARIVQVDHSYFGKQLKGEQPFNLSEVYIMSELFDCPMEKFIKEVH